MSDRIAYLLIKRLEEAAYEAGRNTDVDAYPAKLQAQSAARNVLMIYVDLASQATTVSDEELSNNWPKQVTQTS